MNLAQLKRQLADLQRKQANYVAQSRDRKLPEKDRRQAQAKARQLTKKINDIRAKIQMFTTLHKRPSPPPRVNEQPMGPTFDPQESAGVRVSRSLMKADAEGTTDATMAAEAAVASVEEPIYKNPFVIAGVAVGGLLLIQRLMKTSKKASSQ